MAVAMRKPQYSWLSNNGGEEKNLWRRQRPKMALAAAVSKAAMAGLSKAA